MENILQWNREKSTTSNADFFENLVRESARKMLAAALESEVQEFIQKYQHKLDSDGHRTVVCRCYAGNGAKIRDYGGISGQESFQGL